MVVLRSMSLSLDPLKGHDGRGGRGIKARRLDERLSGEEKKERKKKLLHVFGSDRWLGRLLFSMLDLRSGLKVAALMTCLHD